jgi:hypothetical protein
LTYENRYRAYQTPTLSNEKLIECNSLLDKNATAFGIRISQNQVFSNDIQNFIRSVITEVGWIAGVDVVLLYFVDGDKNSVVPTNIPEEFQPLLRIHDRFDIVTEFPTEAVVFDGVFQQAGYPAIGVFGHMSGLWFMKKNPQYEFMWIIESDVRSTGSWARILDHLGTNQDFMTTYPIEKTDPTWVWKSPKFDQDDLYNGLQVFYGTSKSFAAIAYRELELGNNAFLEQFLPSVAKKNNMTTSYTALPVYGKVELTEWINELFVYNKRKMPSWAIVKGTESHLFEVGSTFVNFGGAAAQPFYEHWITEPSFCPTTAIIHPIKM